MRSYLQPDTQIGGNEMHETQPGGELPSIDVHLLIQEHKVHLEEDEHQLEAGAQEPKTYRIWLFGGCYLMWHNLDIVIACLLSSNISPSSIPV